MTTSQFDPDVFIETREYRRFAGFCRACKEHGYIAVCYGPPGAGKTWSSHYFCSSHKTEAAILASLRKHSISPEVALCSEFVYTPATETTPKRIKNEINNLRRRLNMAVSAANMAQNPPNYSTPWESIDRLRLVIVDEANRLKPRGFETLREIYDDDDNNFGIIFNGMPGIEKMLEKYPQLYSRIGDRMEYRLLSLEDDVRAAIINQWDILRAGKKFEPILDENIMIAIIHLARRNFRLTKQLLTKIAVIMAVNDLTCIDKDIIENAREALLLGEI